MAAQEPPDILHVDVDQRVGQQRPGPASKPFRRRFIQQPQNPLVGGLRIDRPLAWPRLVLQPFKAMVGIAISPKADNPRLDPNLLGNRPRAAPGRRQQNDPSPLQIALSPASGNTPQAPCDLSSKGGLLLLRVSSRC